MQRNGSLPHQLCARLGWTLVWLALAAAVLASCGQPLFSEPPCATYHSPSIYPRLLQAVCDMVYLQTDDQSLFALHTSDGVLRWKYHLPWDEMETGPEVDGIIYVAGPSSPSLFTVDALRASDGKLLWKLDKLQGDSRLLGAAGGLVYVYDAGQSLLLALREIDGTRRWQVQHPVDGPFVAVRVVNDMVYSLTLNGTVTALSASDGTLAWRSHVGEGIDWARLGSGQGPLAVADGVVYVIAQEHIWALQARDGAILWSFPRTAQGGLQLALEHGRAYILSDRLYALRASDGAILWQFPQRGFPRNSPHVPNFMRAALLVGPGVPLSLVGGVVYVGPAFGEPVSFSYGGDRMAALRSSDGKLLWYYQVITNIPTHLSLVGSSGEVVYLFSAMLNAKSGTLSALRAATGKLLWQRAVTGAQPVLAGGAIYAGLAGSYADACSTQSNSRLDKLRASDGAMLWHVESASVTTPVL
jgi:outer membrane protein assembly factor BamB